MEKCDDVFTRSGVGAANDMDTALSQAASNAFDTARNHCNTLPGSCKQLADRGAVEIDVELAAQWTAKYTGKFSCHVALGTVTEAQKHDGGCYSEFKVVFTSGDPETSKNRAIDLARRTCATLTNCKKLVSVGSTTSVVGTRHKYTGTYKCVPEDPPTVPR